ncbi:MAG: DUF2914 domain-containing protein [Desulfobacterales bacterium]|nr:DUF2914 domain-containing protein [Desulfobacterales bacterium]
MNKEKIEERDQRLVKKIREIVRNKERTPGNKRHVRQIYKFWLPVLCAGLMMSGLMFCREQLTTIGSNHSEPKSRDTLENSEAPILEKSTDQTEIKALFRGTAPKTPEVLLSTDRSAEIIANAPSKPAEQSSIPSSIQISEIVSCSRVSKRQYVSPKKIFSLKEESTPVVWMTVLSDKPPFTLIHVYYVNGNRYCEVPLKICYHRMRTWSKVTLNSMNHYGKWRVEVITDSGEKLVQLEFTVVP